MLDEKSKYYIIPNRAEWIAFGILIAATLLARLHHLSADPPIDLSTSQGAFTDPAQYVSYARNYILWGTFNPLHDFRLIFFLKSTTTVLAVGIFKLLGVGYWQSNVVGLIFSFSTIVLFYFAVRKIAGNVAALCFMLFIVLDYNQIFYGRLPFLENSLNFFVALSFVILLHAKRFYAFLLAGIFLGLGIFFGKIIGLLTLFPFTCFALYEYFYDYKDKLTQFIIRYGLFICGFLAIMAIWYYISYQPMSASVEGYIEEQALNLYGTPEAFQSLNKFVYNYISFGATTRLLERIIVPYFLAMSLILLFLFRAVEKGGWKNRLGGINAGTIFIIAYIVAAYGSLMIWNYRPLRYQTMMIYPICASAGIFIAYLLGQNKREGVLRSNYIFGLFLFIIASIPIYHLLRPIFFYFDLPFHFLEIRLVLFITTVLFVIGAMLAIRFLPVKILKPAMGIKFAFIIAVILLTIIPNIDRYLEWNSRVSFNTVNNSKDMATLLSPEAVISGPYAADFTLENKYRNFIHMFGVASVDSSIFSRYPVTHLVLDKSNEERARKDYSYIMDNAIPVTKYNVGGRDMSLYRIVGLTGNRSADQYKLSAYEMALHYFVIDTANIMQGHKFMDLYLRKHPQNMSGNMTYAIMALYNRAYQDAERFYRKGAQFSPTDFRLHFLFGEFYIEVYNNTGNSDYKNKALVEFDLARKYNLGSKLLESKIKDLLYSNGKSRN